ncbi:hypothetical protein ABH922_000158 [Rhodococcus sp. 27YEA15]|uniref:hypothetical protein n=1 Tax=Rhodococcus sp. 27YEA15 TaxID=3156259 RepID=UPI003C7CD580
MKTSDRTITIVDDADTLTGALMSRPGQLTTVYSGLRSLTTNLPPALADGPWLNADIRLTTTELYPYRNSDCPRYGDFPGTNCPAAPASLGGTVGPVGSDTERAVVAALTGSGGAMENLVLGPVLRGTTVVRP